MMTRPFVFAFIALLSGCAVKGDYSCGIPKNGVGCQSMSDTQAQLADGSLASLHTEPFSTPPLDDAESPAAVGDNDGSIIGSSAAPVSPDAATPGGQGLPSIATVQGVTAILSPPRELRIWFNRFTDADGDLHDESFVFIRLDNGHWVIDDNPVLY